MKIEYPRVTQLIPSKDNLWIVHSPKDEPVFYERVVAMALVEDIDHHDDKIYQFFVSIGIHDLESASIQDICLSNSDVMYDETDPNEKLHYE